MSSKKLFFDLETTGTNYRKHGIHQIAGLVEIDDKVVEEFDWAVQPHPRAQVDPGALEVCGVEELDLLSYPPMKEVFVRLETLLGKYVDRYDRTDKFWMVGFNNRAFDDPFMRAWFEQNGSTFFGSWFWSDSRDVLVLASEYLEARRRAMPSFKLARVAREVGLDPEQGDLHDASWDVRLTRGIYRIVTGRA